MVEIIPKPIKKIPEWRNLLFYLSLAVLAAVISGFFILKHYETKSVNALQNLEDKIAAVGGSEAKILEAGIFADQKKINDFSTLIDKHQKYSNFFQLLETITHPKVWFSDLVLDVNTSQAVISGKAPNFQILGQQLLILQANASIKNVELSKLSISKEGETEFTFILYLDPKIFHE